MMRPGFIFGQGTDTPDAQTLQRRRSIADQLIEASLMRAPQTFGEGLTAIGMALAGRMQDRRVTEQENRARERASQSFGEAMSALGFGGQLSPSAPQSPSATPSQGGGGRQPGALMQPFMQAVQSGGVTNPYALAAIAATGIHESGFDPANATRTWSDPSESGQPGTSGGIMSWRGPRLSAMQDFAQGDMSAERQAAFFLQENPQLVQQLNAAQNVDEAAAIMANAWRFAGYNRPGGEAAARAATAASLLPQFLGQAQAVEGPMQPAAPTPVDVAQAATQQGAVNTAAPFLMGVSGQSGNEIALVRMPDGTTQRLPARMQGGSVMIEGLGMSGGVGEPVQMQGQPVAPAPMTAPQAPAAQQPIQPQSGGISPVVMQLAELVQNPYLPEGQRAVAQMLLQQQMQGMDPMRAIEMERARLELEALRNPPQEPVEPDWVVINGQLVDRNAPGGPSVVPIQGYQEDEPAPGFRMATPEEAAQYGAAAGQFGPDGRFYPINPPTGMTVESDGQGGFRIVQGAGVGTSGPQLTEGQSRDNVYLTRAQGAFEALNGIDETLTNRTELLLDQVPLGFGRSLQTPEFQQAAAAGREFLQAILRKDTGAAITTQEVQEYGSVYLPQPGDTPEMLDWRRQARARALEALRAGMNETQMQTVTRALAASSPNAQGVVSSGILDQTPSDDLSAAAIGAMEINDLLEISPSELRGEALQAYVERLRTLQNE